MNSYNFSVLNVNLLAAVKLFSMWLPSGVSSLLPFVTDHLSGRLLEKNRLVPKVFVKIGSTACVLTIASDLCYARE